MSVGSVRRPEWRAVGIWNINAIFRAIMYIAKNCPSEGSEQKMRVWSFQSDMGSLCWDFCLLLLLWCCLFAWTWNAVVAELRTVLTWPSLGFT
jgi:hypothetical protein